MIPGGASIEVSIENREQFIALTKQKILETIVNEVKPQFQAFMKGFSCVARP